MWGKSGTTAGRAKDDAAPTLGLVRRLAKEFISRHRRRIGLGFVCMAIGAGSTAMRAWLMQPTLDRIFVGRDESLLLLIAGAALALAIVKGLADYGEAVLMSRVGQRVITDVQGALYARLIRADLAYFNANASGTLISRFIADVGLSAQRRGERLGGDRQGRGHGGVPGRADVLRGLGLGAGLVLRLSAGDPPDRRDRPADAAGVGQHPDRGRANFHAAQPDLPGRPPRQGLRHGGLRDRPRQRAVRAHVPADRPRQPHPVARLAADGGAGRLARSRW